jgi:hypothetical protein
MIILPDIASVIHICKSLSYQQALPPSHPSFIRVGHRPGTALQAWSAVVAWLLTSASFVSFVPLVVHSSLAAAKRSSTAPNRSSNLPNRSRTTQLERLKKQPNRTTISRQTTYEFDAEKYASNLSAYQPRPTAVNASKPF